MCFLVFTSHSSLLLLHVNNILSATLLTTLQHEESFGVPFFQTHTLISYVFQGYFFWDLQSEYKNKNRVDICPKQMHFENSSDSLNRYTYT